jgi:A/G-specific adenine glycosylase
MNKLFYLGRYTASAISSIAFDQCVPVVDGNVCRVLSRLKGVANNIKAPIFKDKIGWTLATQIVEAGDGKNAGEVNQALMELGATYCAPSGTGVDSDDPLRDHWLSTKLGKDVGQIVISDTLSIEEFISKAAIERGGTECQLCQPNDIEGFLLKCSEDLEVKRKGLSLKDFEVGALISGHASLPIPPPKKAKREEILAMAVFSSLNEGTHEERWLMVKRPNEGLLAGQWEFPSSCVWISNKKKSSSSKEKVAPTSFDPNIRKESIDNMMSNFTFPVDQHGEVSMNKIWQEYQGRVVTPEPLEHIFSHVKHTMFVEYIDISSAQFSLRHDTYQSRDEREFRWMTKVEMKNVGITSGVKKVLIAIEKARPTQRRKRKRE